MCDGKEQHHHEMFIHRMKLLDAKAEQNSIKTGFKHTMLLMSLIVIITLISNHYLGV